MRSRALLRILPRERAIVGNISCALAANSSCARAWRNYRLYVRNKCSRAKLHHFLLASLSDAPFYSTHNNREGKDRSPLLLLIFWSRLTEQKRFS